MTDDELFLIDEARLEKEAQSLAARIIADDHPEHEFAATLARTKSPLYSEMLVARAGAIVSRMAVSEQTAPPIALMYGNRLGKFLHHARLARGLWEFQEGL